VGTPVKLIEWCTGEIELVIVIHVPVFQKRTGIGLNREKK